MASAIPTRVNFSELPTTDLLLVMCDLSNKADALTRSKSPVKDIVSDLMHDLYHAVSAEYYARKGKAV